ncbi:Alpha-methylacyl-CoA racemase, partial [hydrothermal vent metagenome]
RPLSQMKILDFSTLLPGPYATLLLADMGADVLRVEHPSRPDLTRKLPPMVDEDSATHHYLNRNKKSVALDLKEPGSVDIVKKLVLEYDIVIEQFRPGVMARLGLDYDSLKLVNPRIIYCSITGYGQTGPYRDRAGHDINYLAVAGAASYTGRKNDGPLPLGLQVADIAGGSHHAVMAVLAAEIQRRTDGIGQYIDISMTDAAFALNGMAGANGMASGRDPDYEGELLNGASFYDHYPTADGRYMSIGALEPKFISNLAEVLNEPALLGLADYNDRRKQQQLKTLLKEIIARRSYDHWCAVFAHKDCCVEPVLTITEAADHPQMTARDMVVDYVTDQGVSLKQMACPIKFSASKQPAPSPAPATGRDQEILSRLL